MSESDCRRTNRIDGGPEGSTGVLDPVNQTGSDIQTDRLNIGTINGPASSGETPPSSDSGVHSWEEQWENMSENSMEGTSEQTDRSNYGSSVRGHMSDIRAPPNTEEEGDSDYPWADRLLSKESDGSSSNVVYRNDRRLLYNAVTGYGSDSSAANSGNLGRNSDIGALSDFSDDMEETEVKQLSGCRMPDCKCDGRVVNMKWGPDGLSDMDDSDYERNTSDRVFQTDQESPKLGPTVQPIMVADDVIPIPWDHPVDHERGSITESEVNISSDEVSNLCDRPVMDSEMKWDNEVLPEPSDPIFGPCVKRMVFVALERDEDSLVDDEYPMIIKCIVKNVWMLRRAWYEHDTRLEEQQTVCTTPGCQCDRRYDLMFRKLAYGMDTDDSESENIADQLKGRSIFS